MACEHGWMMGSALVMRPPCPHCEKEELARLQALCHVSAPLTELDAARKLIEALRAHLSWVRESRRLESDATWDVRPLPPKYVAVIAALDAYDDVVPKP